MKGRDNSEDLDVDGKIILKWILGKLSWRVRIEFIWLRIGPVSGSCLHGNEPSGDTKGRKFFDYLSVLFSFSRRPLLHGNN
jgi:hypothetical protein